MWERFMTKPLVDKGIFRRIGIVLPWPCFVIAVRDEILEKYPEAIKDILSTIMKKLPNFQRHSQI
jgi:hypothetical protein